MNPLDPRRTFIEITADDVARSSGPRLSALQAQPRAVCPIDQTVVEDGSVQCQGCRVLYHQTCIEFMGRCPTPACRGGGFVVTRPARPAPERPSPRARRYTPPPAMAERGSGNRTAWVVFTLTALIVAAIVTLFFLLAATDARTESTSTAPELDAISSHNLEVKIPDAAPSPSSRRGTASPSAKAAWPVGAFARQHATEMQSQRLSVAAMPARRIPL